MDTRRIAGLFYSPEQARECRDVERSGAKARGVNVRTRVIRRVVRADGAYVVVWVVVVRVAGTAGASNA